MKPVYAELQKRLDLKLTEQFHKHDFRERPYVHEMPIFIVYIELGFILRFITLCI